MLHGGFASHRASIASPATVSIGVNSGQSTSPKWRTPMQSSNGTMGRSTRLGMIVLSRIPVPRFSTGASNNPGGQSRLMRQLTPGESSVWMRI